MNGRKFRQLPVDLIVCCHVLLHLNIMSIILFSCYNLGT
jgi:hypothetical protein